MDFDQQLTTDRQTAFKLLHEIVEENHAAGQLSYGAALKPALLRRTNNGFSEPRLQYSSFGEFLSEAERGGHISLHPAPRGPDRLATPPGTVPPATEIAPSQRRPRIKKELWECFINWEPGWIRVYDRTEARARKVPKDQAPLEPEGYAQLRAAVAEGSDGERFVPIDPVTFDEQVGWMRSFAEGQSDPDIRSRLMAATNDQLPARAFTQALASVPAVRWRWNAHRLGQVESRIRQWAADAGLDIEIYEARPVTPASAPDEARSVAASTKDERLTRLRAALHDAIDRMPEAELQELRLPIGYVVE